MGELYAQKAVMRGGALDALRFFASLFVVLFHYGDEAPIALAQMHPLWSRGYYATDFFLILSGFVLAQAYGHSLNSGRVKPWTFWIKRMARSYPTHILTLGLLIILVGVATAIGKSPSHPEHFPLSGIPGQIFLLHVFGSGGGQWNIPAWTLSALMLCYAVMPWLWRALSRLPGPFLPLGLALTLILASQVISLNLLHTSLFQLPYHLALLRAFPLFLVGLLLARCVQTGHWSPLSALMVAGSGAVLLYADATSHIADTLGLAAIILITLGCGAYPVTRPLPGAAWGAKVSFSLFMTHTLTGAILFAGLKPMIETRLPALASGLGAWVFWFGVMGASIIVAHVYNQLIDAPLQRWIRARWFTPAPAAPSSPVISQPASRPISN